jgi:hypothetical protein
VRDNVPFSAALTNVPFSCQTTVGTFSSTSLALQMSTREDGRWTKEEEVAKRDLLF